MMRRAIALALLILLVAGWATTDWWLPPERIAAPSARAIDGDSLRLTGSGGLVRIHGIDAPEYRQSCETADGSAWPCGRAARAQLEALVLAGGIDCVVEARDEFGRAIARCSAAGTEDVGAAMVAAGLALSPAERGTAPYADEEDVARAARRGIWQGEFQTPAEWRTAHPRRN
jgi:endonuclease YncB( thermonuclease family)